MSFFLHKKLQIINFIVMPVTYLLDNFVFLYSADRFHGIAHLRDQGRLFVSASSEEDNTSDGWSDCCVAILPTRRSFPRYRESS